VAFSIALRAVTTKHKRPVHLLTTCGFCQSKGQLAIKEPTNHKSVQNLRLFSLSTVIQVYKNEMAMPFRGAAGAVVGDL
jgi:hypothetical protein